MGFTTYIIEKNVISHGQINKVAKNFHQFTNDVLMY